MVQDLFDTLNKWDLQHRNTYISAAGYLQERFEITERHAHKLVNQIYTKGWIKPIRENDYILTNLGREKADKKIKWSSKTPATYVSPFFLRNQNTANQYPAVDHPKQRSKIKSVFESILNALKKIYKFTDHEVVGNFTNWFLGLLALYLVSKIPQLKVIIDSISR